MAYAYDGREGLNASLADPVRTIMAAALREAAEHGIRRGLTSEEIASVFVTACGAACAKAIDATHGRVRHFDAIGMFREAFAAAREGNQ